MQFKSQAVCCTGLAALFLVGSSYLNSVGAQSQVFANPFDATRQYGLLNGDLVSLYLNDRGDLGAPVVYVGGIALRKNGGILDPVTGRPLPANIGPNGAILPTSNPPGYGALWSETSTRGAANIGASVLAKSELLTGAGSAVEGYSFRASNNNMSLPGNRFIQARDLRQISFNATGNDVAGPLSAVSALDLGRSRNNLELKQTVLHQQPGAPLNRVTFNLEFTNKGTTAVQGFRYARVIDPNPSPTTEQNNLQFGTDADPNAFALTGELAGNALAIGVFDSVPGTILTTANNSTLDEGLLLESPLSSSNGHYVELLANKAARLMLNAGDLESTADDTVLFTTSNFATDTVFQSEVEQNLSLPGARSTALILLSPELTLQPNVTQNFTFYYFFDGALGSNVPEPGSLALLVSGLFSGGLLLRRRRK